MVFIILVYIIDFGVWWCIRWWNIKFVIFDNGDCRMWFLILKLLILSGVDNFFFNLGDRIVILVIVY